MGLRGQDLQATGTKTIKLPLVLCMYMYEGRSKSSRKSVIIFLFCESAELNYFSYIDKHDMYLYSK